MNEVMNHTYTVERDKLAAVIDDVPSSTGAAIQAVLNEMQYDLIVFNREGHPPPWEITAYDVRLIEAAVNRLESE